MDQEIKHPKKKRVKKDVSDGGAMPKGLEALAKFTNSDVIRQVKAGMSRIAPLEPEVDDEDIPEFTHPDEPNS